MMDCDAIIQRKFSNHGENWVLQKDIISHETFQFMKLRLRGNFMLRFQGAVYNNNNTKKKKNYYLFLQETMGKITSF